MNSSDVQTTTYRTRCGVTVHRTASPCDPEVLSDLVASVEYHRGGVLSSGMEYPGRYDRWHLGYVDPCLEITTRGRRVTATALIEVADSADEQPIEAAADVELRWLHRGAAEPGSAELLDDALAGVAVPASDRHLFLFGESRTVRRLRDAVMRRGVRLDEISAKGYWNLGRAARD